MLAFKRMGVTLTALVLAGSSTIVPAAASDKKPLWDTRPCAAGWTTFKPDFEGDLPACEGREWKKCVFPDKVRYAHWCPPKVKGNMPKGFRP